jgi:hypothetical protein
VEVPFPFDGWPSEIVVNWNHSGTEKEKPADPPQGWDEASEDGDGDTDTDGDVPPQSGGWGKDQWWLKYPGCNFRHLDLVGLLRSLKVRLKKVPGKDGWFSLRRCPWEKEHTTSNGELDAVILPPDRKRGIWWGFKCLHAHCADRGLNELLEWAEAKKPGIVKEFCKLPNFLLPSGKVPYPDCGRKLWGGHLAPSRELFVRDRLIVVIWQRKMPDGQIHDVLVPVDAYMLRSIIDHHVHVQGWRMDRKGNPELRDCRCSNDTANVLLKMQEAYEYLPRINQLSSCPVLAGETGKLRVLYRGYHEEYGGIYVTGGTEEIKIPPLEEALKVFEELLCDYQWVTGSDKSRAVASFLSPALRAGGLLKADFPIDIAEADQSQSGKTYRQKLVCAVYGATPYVVTQRVGGVGSLDESISTAILSGVPFILVDNFRGRVNSQPLESALRGAGVVNVRVPHKGEMQIATGYINWMLSSNGIEGGRDFANRAVVTGIRKQAEGYKFKEYAGRDILGAVKVDQKRYLGAIFTVLMEWAAPDGLKPKKGGTSLENGRKRWIGWCKSCSDYLH